MFTRHVARKSIGGKAPRKTVAGKGGGILFFGGNQNNTKKRYQVNFTELKERYQQIDQIADHDLVEFINQQYENCDDIVKQWIYDDLVLQKEEKQDYQSENEEMIDASLFKQLDDNTKYEILQFIPTFTPTKVAPNLVIEGSKIENHLDSVLVTYHKMRLINKYFNKLMIKKILTLKDITLRMNDTAYQFFSILSAAQTSYKKTMESDRNYDIDINKVLMYEETNIGPNNLFGGSGQYFGETPFNTAVEPFTKAVLNVWKPFDNPADHNKLLGELLTKKHEKTNPHKIDVNYMREEVELYNRADTHSQTLSYSMLPCNQNETIESITIIIEGPHSFHFLQSCPNLKKVNFLFPKTASLFIGDLFNFTSSSVEEIYVCGADLIEYIQNQPYLLSSLCGDGCPNLKSITLAPLLPNMYTQENLLENCFSQLLNANPSIAKLNIFDKIGKNESVFIKSELFTTTNPKHRELNVYCLQYKSVLNINILEELYEIFGNQFVASVLPSILLNAYCPPSYLYDQSLLNSYLEEHTKKFRETVHYFFKRKKLPISMLSLSTEISQNETNLRDVQLQYLIYFCNQYQNSELLFNLNSSIQQGVSTIIRSIHYGWNFTGHVNDLLEFFVKHNSHRGVVALLNNFNYDENFIGSLLKYLAVVGHNITQPKMVITELIMYLLRKNSKKLFSILVQPIQITSDTITLTIPILAFLFKKADSYLLSKIINEMDMEIFNSIGQNNRGDNLLHILLYLQQDLNYLIFYSLINKNPNLINMVNHKLQTPLHYLMLSPEKRSALLLPEIAHILKANNISLDMNMHDYMEHSPEKILKSEEVDQEDILF